MLSQAFAPDPRAFFADLDLAGRKSLVAAVSGGGDSLALLILLRDHLQTVDNAPSLLAVTVDHGLRPESAGEARRVAEICGAYDIAHRVVAWRGPKPSTGVAAAAREARFALLAEVAGEAGSDLVMTGHTADDQAETLAMRLARGEGRGAAGIAPATLYAGRVWFVRPLLGTRRADLRRFLRGRGLSWIEDPSNRDPRFERVRVRGRLGEKEIGRLVHRARQMAAERKDAGEKVAALIAASADRPAPGLLRLSRHAFDVADEKTANDTLRLLLAVAGGTPHLPEAMRAAALLKRAERGRGRASLSRAVVSVRGEQIFLHRERRNLPRCAAADEIVWDGRYRISGLGAGADVLLGPYGAENARTADIAGHQAPPGLVRAALAAEPALWKGERCLALAAQRPDLSVRPLAGPWAWLLPCFDLAPARAVARVIGAARGPDLPLRRHKGQHQ